MFVIIVETLSKNCRCLRTRLSLLCEFIVAKGRSECSRRMLEKEICETFSDGEIISSLFEFPYRYNDRCTRDYLSDP